MVQPDNGKKDQMQLALTRERAKEQTITNLIAAGVLLRGEAARYERILDSYDNTQLTRVMLVSHMLREEAGDIYRPDVRD
ncbi:hypothetical protein ES706_06156 [subsurface metagenome]